MRVPMLMLTAVAIGAQTVACQARPAPAATTIATLNADVIGDVASTLNGRRLYYLARSDQNDRQFNSVELWMYDPTSRKSTKIIPLPGRTVGLKVTASGDRIAFARTAETGPALFIWTIPLDPKTGLASGPARRTSMSEGRHFAFSPDGRSIAFGASESGKNQRLTVVPSTGGPERVVFSGVASEPTSWSPDGQFIYYTAWAENADNGVIQRIAATGGKPETLIDKTWIGYPGFSPDGKLISYDLQDDSGMVLTDAKGKVLVDTLWASAWLSPTSLLSTSSHRRSGLSAISMADGKVRELLPASFDITSVYWAPDGKRFVALSRRGDSDLVIFANADGSQQRTVAVPFFLPCSASWSPDSRWIAVCGSGGRMVAIEAASGAVHILTTSTSEYLGARRWTSDSRAIRYVSNRPDTTHQVSIREVTLAGVDRLVREVQLTGCRCLTTFISDTAIATASKNGVTVSSLTTGKTARVYDGPSSVKPIASPQGDVLTVLPVAAQGLRPLAAELYSMTGVHRATVPFPNGIGDAVNDHFIFTPDGKNLIASGRDATGVCCVVYIAPIAGGPARTLAELPKGEGVPNMDLSPDGRTLLVTTKGDFLAIFKSYDVSKFVH